ncbi:hypothetical protein [Bacillus toyonensis]|uniref:hypothetical protein n=1 Tax=Bacillus toyonensis TaxID=155322 RepID=UPI0015CF4787|nr:hypothetical protein [Bacillus toyonensis]
MNEVNANDNSIHGKVIGTIEINGKQLLLVEQVQHDNSRGMLPGMLPDNIFCFLNGTC